MDRTDRTTGDGGQSAEMTPDMTPGIRASDAERDATLARLSAATGEGRLTLEEFSQRMEQATAARTRDELGRLVADLPEEAAAGRSAVASQVPATAAAVAPSWHVTPIGGLRVYGPWTMDRHVIVVSIVGGTRLDLSQVQLAAPEVTLTKVSLVGGVRVWVPPGIRVDVSGFSLLGGTRVYGGPEPGPGAPTVHIRAFSLVGGVRIRRDRDDRRDQEDRRPRRDRDRDRPRRDRRRDQDRDRHQHRDRGRRDRDRDRRDRAG